MNCCNGSHRHFGGEDAEEDLEDEQGRGLSLWEIHFPHAGQLDEVRIDFMHCWDQIRYSPGEDLLELAVELGERFPVPLDTPRSHGYRRFLSLAYWLQRLKRDHSIFLSTRLVGKKLDFDQRTISILIRGAEKNGYLTLVTPHHFTPGGKRNKAREFRFDVGRFPSFHTDGVPDIHHE